ncbi:hypothetical protein C8R47DRAFT_1218861 [Mycena vitilis]|nr:hypothetical protein C8R47DRAFT_1218861 [Mycena vitilis]
MPPHASPSSPLNPNARPFPYSSPRPPSSPFTPTSRFASSPYSSPHLAVSRFAARFPRIETPPLRARPLAPIECDVLDRGRTGTFGPEDTFPRTGSAVARVRVAANAQWIRHRSGQPPLVRPGSIVAPQTLYTGREIRPNGQELHHAVFLNARMLIHDPATGRPGMQNGHAIATLVAAPADNRTWEHETAFPSTPDIQSATNYSPATQAEIGRQRRPGRHRLGIDRRVERLASTPPVGEGTPRTPVLPTILPPPIPQDLRLAPITLPNPLTPTLPVVPLPSIQRMLQMPPPNLLVPPPSRVVLPQKNSFFYTHPPRVAPRVDTSAMTHAGYAVDTGHRVLAFPSSLRTVDNEGRSRRPDTPGLQFRLLTEPPTLVEDPAEHSSDVDMPPASPTDRDHSPEPPRNDPSEDSTESQESEAEEPAEETQHQKWPESNVRLEKLQYEAKRCVVSKNAPENPTPKFVFSVRRSSVVAAENRTVRVAQHSTDASSKADEMVVVGDNGRSVPGSDTPISSTASSGKGPTSRFSHESDYFSTQPAFSSASSSSQESAINPEDAISASHPGLSFDHYGPHAEDFGPSRASSPDCHSALQSPRLPADLLDDSDDGSLPSLRSVSQDQDEAGEKSKEPVLHVNHAAFPVNRVEVDGYLTRIGRGPPSPSNHTWTINQDWTQRRTSFLRNLESAENADARALIRQLDVLLERTPEIVDRPRMQANNEYVDADHVHQLQYPAVTSDGCREIAERAQRAQEARDMYSPGVPDAARSIHNITHVAVSEDGRRLRQLSDRAIKQALMYRYAIELIVKQRLPWIQPYSELRRKGMALLYYLDDLSKRRRGTVDQTFLHQPCPVPPPYFHPHEYARLRILKYTFERDGYSEVGQALDELLRYRFKEADVVAHLLYAGLFDPKDVLLAEDGTYKEIARRIDKSHLAEICSAQGALPRHL